MCQPLKLAGGKEEERISKTNISPVYTHYIVIIFAANWNETLTYWSFIFSKNDLTTGLKVSAVHRTVTSFLWQEDRKTNQQVSTTRHHLHNNTNTSQYGGVKKIKMLKMWQHYNSMVLHLLLKSASCLYSDWADLNMWFDAFQGLWIINVLSNIV